MQKMHSELKGEDLASALLPLLPRIQMGSGVEEIAEVLLEQCGLHVEPFDPCRHADAIGNVVAFRRCLPSVLPDKSPQKNLLANVILIDCQAAGLRLAQTTIDGLYLLGHEIKYLGRMSKWPEKVRVKKLGLPMEATLVPGSLGDFFPVARDTIVSVLSSNASGLCIDQAVICEMHCRTTDLSALSAQDIHVDGACIWEDCLLDGLRLTDYLIDAGGELAIRSTRPSKRSVIEYAVFRTRQPNLGRLVLGDITFKNCRFNADEGDCESVFSPSEIKGVVFEHCDFGACRICPNGDNVELVFSSGSSLRNVHFEKLRGSVDIRDCHVSVTFSDSDDIRRLSVSSPEPIQLSMNHVRLRDFRFNEQTIELFIGEDVTCGPWSENGASLAGSTISGADFSAIAWEGGDAIDATGTCFRKCNFSGMSMSRFRLCKTVFESCNFTNAVFDGKVDGITIKGADTQLPGVRLGKETIAALSLADVPSEQASALDLSGGVLADTHFTGLDFNGLKAVGTDMRGCVFENCRFSACDFTKAHFAKSAKANCEFKHADFSGQEEFRGVVFESISCDADTDFANSLFVGCTIGSDSMFAKGASFTGAVFDACTWAGTALDMTKFPFAAIAEIRNGTFEGANWANATVGCRLSHIELRGCKLADVVFKCAQIQNVKVEGGLNGALTFSGSTIDGLGIRGEGKNTFSCGPLAFMANPSIGHLRIENICLERFELSETPELFDLTVANAEIARNAAFIRACGIHQFVLKDVDLPGINVASTTLHGSRSVEGCSLLGGNWQECNLFDEECKGIRKTDMTGSEFRQLAVTGDLSKFASAEVKLSDSRFLDCQFDGANLDTCDFTKVEFDGQCDMRSVRGSRIVGSDFSKATLLATIDGLSFDACQLVGTIFSEAVDKPDAKDDTELRRRKLSGVSFQKCKFSDQTRFDGALVIGGDSRPVLFEQCLGWNDLIFEDVVFQKLELEDFGSKAGQHFKLQSCKAGRIELGCRHPRLEIESSEISVLMLKDVEVTHREDFCVAKSKIHTVGFAGCALSGVAFSSSNFERFDVSDTNLEKVHFNYCQLGTVHFVASQPTTPASHETHETAPASSPNGNDPSQLANQANADAPMRLKSVVFNEVLFRNSLIKEAGKEGDIPFRIDNIRQENCEIKLSFYRNLPWGEEQQRIFQDHDIAPDRKGSEADFFKKVPVGITFDAVSELRDLLIGKIPKLDNLRHTGVNFKPELIRDSADAFKFLQEAIRQNANLLSEDTAYEVSNLSYKLHKIATGLDPACPAPEVEYEYQKRFNRMDGLLRRRISVKAESKSSLREWLLDILGEIAQVSIWPEDETQRLYLDFGLLEKILSRIIKNVHDHVPGSKVEVCGEIRAVEAESATCRQAFYLRVQDKGEGWGKAAGGIRERIFSGEMGKLLVEFSQRYCHCIRLGTVTEKRKQIAIDICGNDVRESKETGWFTGGTAYEFQIWLPEIDDSPREKVLTSSAKGQGSHKADGESRPKEVVLE